jgi:hypothetical protein
MKGERTTPTTTRMKTSSSRRIVIVIALLATIVTVGIAVVPASSIVKPAYAQLDISEQIVGEEIEIPDSDAIREKVGELTSQNVPRLAELGSLLVNPRPPPAFAD